MKGKNHNLIVGHLGIFQTAMASFMENMFPLGVRKKWL